MELNNLKPSPGSVKKRRRKGRGNGSGNGTYAGRGMNGQGSRSGNVFQRGYEGGQMPLTRRIPKRGFKNINRESFEIINVGDLKTIEENGKVDLELLRKKGILGRKKRIKLLGSGEIESAISIQVHKASKTAVEKVEKAGGKIEVLDN